MTALGDAPGIARPHLSAMRNRPPPATARATITAGCCAGRRDQAALADLSTYGYRCVHALLRRQAEKNRRTAPNAKRVYRFMKAHGLLQTLRKLFLICGA